MEKFHPKLVQLIREEFEERPELRLTVREASQFWALDEAGCGHALVELAKRGFLAQDGDHRFRMHAEPRPVSGNDATVALRRLSRSTAWQPPGDRQERSAPRMNRPLGSPDRLARRTEACAYELFGTFKGKIRGLPCGFEAAGPSQLGSRA